MFPQLKNKKFLDVSSGRVINVIDQFENIAILDDKSRIDVKRLLDKSFYDEYIDPKEFFNQQNYQIFTEKIKSIPDEVLQKMEEKNESLIMEYDPEEEKRILMEKARAMSPVNALQNQMDKFKNLIDDDIPVVTPTQVVQTQNTENHQMNNQFINRTPPPQTVIKDDPMITMFKNAKRNTDFKISFEIEDKIPKPEFIELMEDSYEISIIDFLADDFTKKLLEDPNFIKNKVKKAIEDIVYKKKLGANPVRSTKDTTKTTNKPVVKKVAKKKSTPKTKSVPPPPPPPDRILKEGEVPVPPTAKIMNGMPEPKK